MQAPCYAFRRVHSPQCGPQRLRLPSRTCAVPAVRWTSSKCPSRAAPHQTSARRRCGVILSAAGVAEAGKEISKTEIPAFIPRPDLLDQLVRWSLSNAQEDGVANFGMPMRIEPFRNSKDDDWGFVVSIVRDGVTLTKIGVMFDEEPVERAEWVGRGADGFPIQEGKMIEVIGKHLIIRRATSRKLDDNPVDEDLRACIRRFCEALVSAMNKYYAFGSCFLDDYT